MAADVVQKVISANDVKNGNSVVSTDKQGNIQSLEPAINTAFPLDYIYGILDTRFDDPTYYSA